jgi:hypothetical protein
MKQVKQLPRDENGKIKTEFEANGQKYLIESSINIKRYNEFEKIQLQLGFGLSFSDMFANLKEAYTLANGQKFADLSVLLYNMMDGIKQMSTDRNNSALSMCTLFINKPDEDRTNWTKEEAQKKLTDWSAEGIDVKDFFLLAVTSIENFANIYKELTADIFKQKITKVKGEDTH